MNQTLNKKSYEKYVARLIKESEHRVLNEYELLTLINYTEGRVGRFFGNAFGKVMGLPHADFRSTDRPDMPLPYSDAARQAVLQNMPENIKALNVNSPARADYIRQANEDYYTQYNRQLDQVDSARANAQARADIQKKWAQRGDQAGDWLARNVGNPIVHAMGQQAQALGTAARQKAQGLKAAAGEKLANMGRSVKSAVTNPENWKSVGGALANAGRAAYGAAVNLANKGAPAIRVQRVNGAIQWQKYDPRVDGADKWVPISNEEAQRYGYTPGQTAAPTAPQNPPVSTALVPQPGFSESTIVKRGKRIKQKPVLTDLQEQLLLYYLKKVNNN